MTTLTQGLYTQFVKPQASGGRVIPLAGGFLHVGTYGSDPTLKNQNGYINHLNLYYIDLQGNKVAINNPVELNSAGITQYNGQSIQVQFDESLYSIAVTDSIGNVQPGYENWRMGQAESFGQLQAACQEFGLPLSAVDVEVKRLEQGMTITGTIGLVANDGSLWFNNGLAGVVTNVPSPMRGIIEVDGSSARLLKKRDENRYQDDYDYLVGDIVIGSNNKRYYCSKDNGPSFGGSIDPTTVTSADNWRGYPSEQVLIGKIKAIKHYDGTAEIFGSGIPPSAGQPAIVELPIDLIEFPVDCVTFGARVNPGSAFSSYTLNALQGISSNAIQVGQFSVNGQPSTLPFNFYISRLARWAEEV